MNPVKIHSVTLKNFTAEELNGQRLAHLVCGHIHCGDVEMHVSESFEELGKHVVSMTLVVVSEAKHGAELGQIRTNKVTLDQATVDKIEVANDTTEYGRYAKMGGCPFVVLVELFSPMSQ